MKLLLALFTLILSLLSFSSSAMVIVEARANSSSGGVGGSTGIFFNTGDYFTATVASDDLWNAGARPRWSNADGLVADLYATGSDESGYAAGTLIGQNFGTWMQHGLTAAYGSLVGSIDGQYFLMGTNYSGTAVGTGELLLWYWDSNNGDNSEQISVSFGSVASVSEPEIITLLGVGILGLILSRRFQA
ncbi:MAG: hypothetical protein ACMZ64_05305 [Oleiphilus sp.]